MNPPLRHWRNISISITLTLGFGLAPVKADADAQPQEKAVRAAIERGLRRIEQGAANYTKNRQCFSCHHQAMSIRSLTSARRHGFEVEPAKIDQQVDFTVATFKPKIDTLMKGQGVGGASTTVGYALWALHAVERPGDETSTAMVRFLLSRQREDGAWVVSANRPPTEASNITTTAVALIGLKAYRPGSEAAEKDANDIREKVDQAIAKGVAWLKDQKPASTEDRVFKIFGLAAVGTELARVADLREELLDDQREDGGWAQLASMESDAYATGSVLMALRVADLKVSERGYQKGVKYLLTTQRPDGAWLVTTRSRPIQTFFDNGDPGDKSQFISFVATNWAVQALLETCPTPAVRPSR